MQHEAAFSLRFIAPIAFGQARSRDEQLPRDACGAMIEHGVHDEHFLPSQGAPVGNTSPRGIDTFNFVRDRPDRRFGRATESDKARLEQHPARAARQRRGNKVAAEQD